MHPIRIVPDYDKYHLVQAGDFLYSFLEGFPQHSSGAEMKRQVILTVVKLGGEAILIAIFVGIAVGAIGYWRQWNTSTQYSNAFFIAGCLIIIGGAFSRRNAGQELSVYMKIGSESFGDMSPVERALYIVDTNSSFRLAVLGFITGILLMLISLLVW